MLQKDLDDMNKFFKQESIPEEEIIKHISEFNESCITQQKKLEVDIQKKKNQLH